MIGPHDTGPSELALIASLHEASRQLMLRESTAADVALLLAPAVSKLIKPTCRHWHTRREREKWFCVLCGEQLVEDVQP